jgi:hypothetical protein
MVGTTAWVKIGFLKTKKEAGKASFFGDFPK